MMNEHFRRAAQGAALLKRGMYREGFPLFDAWRNDPTNTNTAPPLPFPRWKGQDVSGKRVLIWSEHGFGDQIMYARFARILVERGAFVSWLCGPEMVKLVESLGVKALIGTQSHNLSCDFYCPSSALPLGFDLTLDAIPATPYLHVNATAHNRIGVMATGSSANPLRSLPPAVADRLLAGAIDLSPGATGAADFYDTAGLIAGLDLVISIDTAVAHLAGSMGKPVWILLPKDADWRWLENRDDSPWYPSATLFRQKDGEGWPEVVDRICGHVLARYA